MTQRIAITGIGAISAYGLGVDAVFGAVCDGRPYDQQVEEAQPGSGFQKCPDINLQRLLSFRSLGRYRKIAQYTIASIKEAVDQAKSSGDKIDHSNVAISYGTSNGPASATQEIYDDLLESGAGSVKPRVFQESVFNSPASLASILFKFTGPISVTPNSLCAGPYALLQGQMFLANPNVYGVVVVCSEEVCDAVQRTLVKLKYLKDNAQASQTTQPFSSDHTGGVISEGSVAVFLEPFDRAQQRGATILAELEGVGCTNDAHVLTKNDSTGIGLKSAIETAQMDSQNTTPPDVIFSGSSCTQRDDELEQNALRSVFPGGCTKQTSTRGVMGISMGVSGLYDLIIGVRALQEGRLPVPEKPARLFKKMASVVVDADTNQIDNMDRVLINSIGVNGLYGAIQIRGV